ncbi:hypothetical protein E4U09_005037 [Claviceps aff. purpurea]|uniref:Uncharacterized protein n=1 Tax=Claviceps aff. purpurea TaxID=1967640 RepID=A0A9P7QLS7_9HYPO|nr:hypothetical protein E4U09_005037 [Claviceps aff. purpurea]
MDSGSSAASLPDFSAIAESARGLIGDLVEQLDEGNNLPAVQDGAQWLQLKTRVDGLENSLTEVKGAVTVTQGDVTTLRGDVTTLRGDVTTLQGGFTILQNDVSTLQGGFTILQNDVTSLRGEVTTLRDDVTTIRGNMTVLTGDVRLLGEGLGEQMRSLATRMDSVINRLTESTQDQAEARIRLEASLVAAARRMATILNELGEPRQARVDERQHELRKMYGAECLSLRVILGEQ